MNIRYESLQMTKYPLRIIEFRNQYHDHSLHWHEEIELLYVANGEGVITCDVTEYRIKKGDIIFVNGKESHKGCDKGCGVLIYCIQINTHFIHNLMGDQYVIFDNFIRDSECASLLESVIEESKKSSVESSILMKIALCNFFWRLINTNHIKTLLTEDEYKKYFKRLDTFNSILEYIEQNYHQDISLKDISDKFFMSSSYFSRFFKTRSGKSVMEYINDVRISHAKLFLEIEDVSISKLAVRVGFNDINYFSRKFKAVTGFTPVEYKKKIRKTHNSQESHENTVD